MDSDRLTIILGNIVHCTEQFKVHIIHNGFVIVLQNKIIEIDEQSEFEEAKARLNITKYNKIEEIKLKEYQILIPGLIDTHIHAPQYPNVGLGYDKPLLDWLDTYTYNLEKKYYDLEFSKKVYDAVVRKSLDYGTTTACYFASMFKASSLVLVDSVITHGQRALVGKINMTKLAPEDYIETDDASITDTMNFIKAVIAKKNDLVHPIVTPRFALSVDMNLMKKLSTIAKEQNLHIQSHISENKSEIQMVKDIFNMSYADTYDKAGLLTTKTILAHGVYLTDDELKLLAKRGTSISHCPDSNTCLKSGMCGVRRLLDAGIKVGLGTDVSGGPSPSIIQAMKAAVDVSIHISFSKENYKPFTFEDVFYLATLGGAEALGLENKIGNFEVGKDFDALIVDMDVEGSSSHYLLNYNPSELLQKFIFLGDDRNIVKVYVAGKRVK